jgi:hypothetical protein
MTIKQFIKRTIYLGYYIKILNYSTFNKYLAFASSKSGRSKSALWIYAIAATYKSNISLMDYFTFRFYEKHQPEREKWAGMGFKYEFDLKADPKSTRQILENKILFYKEYAPFIKHSYFTMDDFKRDRGRVSAVLNNESGKIVLKNSHGQCGYEVEVFDSSVFSIDTLNSYMKQKKFDLCEEFIQQHNVINNLSPTGLNTVRWITMINEEGRVDLLGARLRVSVNNHVDNLASGNIACPIDPETGIVSGPGVYKDITKESVDCHPITGVKLKGFQIPMWDEIMDATLKIAQYRPENRGVGWDIALMNDGPDFIEGNHNWDEVLWQLPANKGMKQVLEQYL